MSTLTILLNIVCCYCSSFPKPIFRRRRAVYCTPQEHLSKTMHCNHVKGESQKTELGALLIDLTSLTISINMMFTPDTPQVRTILGNFLTAHFARSGINLTIDSVPDSFYSDQPPPTSHLGFIPVPSSEFIYNYVLKYPNSTLLGVDFNITGSSYKYEVYYNASLFAGSDAKDFFSPQ